MNNLSEIQKGYIKERLAYSYDLLHYISMEEPEQITECKEEIKRLDIIINKLLECNNI